MMEENFGDLNSEGHQINIASPEPAEGERGEAIAAEEDIINRGDKGDLQANQLHEEGSLKGQCAVHSGGEAHPTTEEVYQRSILLLL